MPRSDEVYLGFGNQPNGHQFETSNASTPSGMLGASGIWLGSNPKSHPGCLGDSSSLVLPSI